MLGQALGVLGVVRKQRLLYLVGQTRVHLDSVEGLGDFLELEVSGGRSFAARSPLRRLGGRTGGSETWWAEVEMAWWERNGGDDNDNNNNNNNMYSHRMTESLRLEKISKITKSNRHPNTTMPTSSYG